jgi:hypothetical protein
MLSDNKAHMLSVAFFYCYAACRHAKGRYAEGRCAEGRGSLARQGC